MGAIRQERRAIATSAHGLRLGDRLRPRLPPGTPGAGARNARRRRTFPSARLSRPAIPSDELYPKCSVKASTRCVRLPSPEDARHTGILSGGRGLPSRRSSPRASAAPRNLRMGRPRAARARTIGRCVRPARRARGIARSCRQARSSPRSLRFRIPRPKRSGGRPPLHREPARGRVRLRFTRTCTPGLRDVRLRSRVSFPPVPTQPLQVEELLREARLPDPDVPIAPRESNLRTSALPTPPNTTCGRFAISAMEAPPLPPVSLARPSALPADGDGTSRRTLASGARSLWVTNASFSVIRRTRGLRRESARSAAERTACGRPSPPRLGGVRRGDRPAHLGAATVGKDGAHLPGGGVGDLEGTAGERLLPLPAHEQGVGVSRYRHSPPPLSRTRGRPAPNPAPAQGAGPSQRRRRLKKRRRCAVRDRRGPNR